MKANLVPRVLRLLGQRVVAKRDSKEFEKKNYFFIRRPVTASIVLPQKSCGKFQYPRVSLGDQPLAKEPEDSGCEIA